MVAVRPPSENGLKFVCHITTTAITSNHLAHQLAARARLQLFGYPEKCSFNQPGQSSKCDCTLARVCMHAARPFKLQLHSLQAIWQVRGDCHWIVVSTAVAAQAVCSNQQQLDCASCSGNLSALRYSVLSSRVQHTDTHTIQQPREQDLVSVCVSVHGDWTSFLLCPELARPAFKYSTAAAAANWLESTEYTLRNSERRWWTHACTVCCVARGNWTQLRSYFIHSRDKTTLPTRPLPQNHVVHFAPFLLIKQNFKFSFHSNSHSSFAFNEVSFSKFSSKTRKNSRKMIRPSVSCGQNNRHCSVRLLLCCTL